MNHEIRCAGWLTCLALAVLAASAPLPFAHADPGASTAKTARSSPRAERQEAGLLPEFTRALRFPGGEGALTLHAWSRLAPSARPVTIASSADGKDQRAFFYDPGTQAPKPLLVVLHSWSTDWRQNIGIPYAVFAERNGWVFVHPDFRGPYRRPEAAASDLVAQDIIDAVEYAKQHAHVDASRIYLAGFSGGGMTALAMAGRRPDLWAGVVAWAPIHDIPDWYQYNASRFPRRHYASNIAAVCGGAPRPGTAAFRECHERSPSALLERARRAAVPVYIGCGLGDDIVPPEHALRAFNQMADPGGQLPEGALRRLAAAAANLPHASAQAFARAGARLRLEQASGSAVLALFEGAHDIVYEPGLVWLSAQRRPSRKGRD